jgi:uncharacterized membrane protein YuzA (DUF378 family)
MNKLALILVIIGALNWLLVGALGFDLVVAIFGSATAIGARIVYCVIGLAGLWSIGLLANLFRNHGEVADH